MYAEDTVLEENPNRNQKKDRDIDDMTTLYTQDIYNMPELDILNEVFANQVQNIPDGPL